MLILGIDSAGDGCNIGTMHDDQILSLILQPMERGQDSAMLPLIQQALAEAKISFDALDRIVVTRGPGSFTGLRIGLATARGLGLALNKPVIGIDRFSIYYEQCKSRMKNLLVVLQSKRKELYCRYYPQDGTAYEPTMMTLDEIDVFCKDHENIIVVGDVLAEKSAITHAKEAEIHTALKLGAKAVIGDLSCNPKPLYVRPPDVTMKAPVISKTILTDIPAIAAVHAENFAAYAWTETQFKSSLELDTTHAWTARVGSQITGFIVCQATQDQWDILMIGVAPTHQRHGIGETLIRQALQGASSDKAKLFLDVAADNVAALALYKKCGFVQTGQRQRYYVRGDKQIDAVLLTRFP
jgi:ribosomal protein S18 acetylase RimI-like enzyme